MTKWVVNGIGGEGLYPPYPPLTSPRDLIIAGSGRSLWTDLRALRTLLPPDWSSDTMAINRAGVDLPSEPDHWVSADAYFFIWGLPQRGFYSENGNPVPAFTGEVHTQDGHSDIATPCHRWKFTRTGGSSTLFALKVALVLGYSRIALCGAGMDGQGHYYDPPASPSASGREYWDSEYVPEWDELDFQDRVRALSGVTKARFGLPSPDWARGNHG